MVARGPCELRDPPVLYYELCRLQAASNRANMPLKLLGRLQNAQQVVYHEKSFILSMIGVCICSTGATAKLTWYRDDAFLKQYPASPLPSPRSPPSPSSPSSLTHTALNPVAQASLSTLPTLLLLLPLPRPAPTPVPPPEGDPRGNWYVWPVYTLTTSTLHTGDTNSPFPNPIEAGGAMPEEFTLLACAAAAEATPPIMPGMSVLLRWVERTID